MDPVNLYKGKTVAVTGGGGYLASVLVSKLLDSEAEILRVSRRDLPNIAGTTTLKGDLRTIDCWKEIISKAEIIFHLSGNTSVYDAAKDCLDSTLLPVVNLISAAQELGCKPRVIFSSTATVYGLSTKLPVTETYNAAPVTNYDLYKTFAEKQLELASSQLILESASFRLANVYGPSAQVSTSSERGVLNKIIRIALKGSSLSIFGTGDYIRDYVYIDDVVRALMIGGTSSFANGRFYNVGTGTGISVNKVFNMVADKVGKITGHRVNIHHIPWPLEANAIEARSFIANIDQISTDLNWRPEINLDRGMDLTINNFNESTIYE